MHTLIRDAQTTKHDFVFYSDRLIRLVGLSNVLKWLYRVPSHMSLYIVWLFSYIYQVVEHGLGHLPFTEKQVITPTGRVIWGMIFLFLVNSQDCFVYGCSGKDHIIYKYPGHLFQDVCILVWISVNGYVVSPWLGGTFRYTSAIQEELWYPYISYSLTNLTVFWNNASGESMENALRACCKGIKIGKILIHREGDNGQQVNESHQFQLGCSLSPVLDV